MTRFFVFPEFEDDLTVVGFPPVEERSGPEGEEDPVPSSSSPPLPVNAYDETQTNPIELEQDESGPPSADVNEPEGGGQRKEEDPNDEDDEDEDDPEQCNCLCLKFFSV